MDSKYLESMQELELKAGFTLEELKKKWRELSKKYHSDRHAQADEVLRELADEKMKKINEAYSYLEKNFNQNSSASYNSNEGNDSDYYNDYDDYEEEDNYNRGDYYFLNDDDELNFLGRVLPLVKEDIDQHVDELSEVVFDKIGRFDYSFKSELTRARTTMLEIFKGANIGFFIGVAKVINKIKKSDIDFLNTLGSVKLRKINRIINEKYKEINDFIYDEDFQDTTYIQLIYCRLYFLIEDIYPDIEKKVIDYFDGFKRILDRVEGNQVELEKQVNILFKNVRLLCDNYSDMFFNSLKKVIYLGDPNYEASALSAEFYYKANIDPAFRLMVYRDSEKNLKSILNMFPNEVNNVLLKLALLCKDKKIEEIEKLSSEITKIQNDEYFSTIIDVVYKDFQDKKESFFINIQILLNKEFKEKMLQSLKEVPKKLEENIDLSFWGKNKENEDFQLLMKKYDFINKNENKSFIEKGNLLVNEILSKYDNLKKVLEENKRLEDLIEVYEYLLSLKENEKIFNFYHINTLLKEEEEVKKEASELSNFFIKSLSTLKSMKEKFLKSKNFLAENISSKEMIKEIEILINEFKPLALRRKKIYEEATGHSAKETLKIVTRAYENMTKFFKELENF